LIPDTLCYVEADTFGVTDLCATFDRRALRTLFEYHRQVKALTMNDRKFPVSVDGNAKGSTIHHFAKTLISFVLQRRRHVSFLWFFPHAAKGVANYRVDVDDHREDSVERVLDQVSAQAQWCSFFFATSVFQNTPEVIIRCRDMGAEVGTHAHYHFTYEHDGKSNARNVRESLRFLRGIGLNIHSYVTPSAKSYAGIGKLMMEEGLEYTSNFGMISDALPLQFQDGSYPYLEVPIHPICPGNISPTTQSNEVVDGLWSAYSRRIANALAASYLPVFLYGHNNDNDKLTYLPEYLDFIVRAFPDHERVTLGGYARFWKHRLERCQSFADDESNNGVASLSPDFPDRIIVTDGMKTRTYPFSLSSFLRPPETYTELEPWQSPYAKFLAWNEFERILPVRLIDPFSLQGLKKIAYKVLSPVCKKIFYTFRRPSNGD
jgi:hypothetical protein